MADIQSKKTDKSEFLIHTPMASVKRVLFPYELQRREEGEEGGGGGFMNDFQLTKPIVAHMLGCGRSEYDLLLSRLSYCVTLIP